MDDDDIDPLLEGLKLKENVLIISNNKCLRNSKINYIYDEIKDIKQTAIRVKKWCLKNDCEVKGIATLDEEYHYRLSEEISLLFGIKIYPREVLDAASNKILQKEMLIKNGLNVAKYKVITQDNISNLQYPNVIKPLSGIGSEGTFFNKNSDDLLANIQKIKRFCETSKIQLYKPHVVKNRTFDPKQEFLVEEYVGGKEYSCDFLVEQGKARVLRICQKFSSKNEFGKYAGFLLIPPSDLVDFRLHALEEECQKIAQGFLLKEGICMVDFKFDSKITILETSIRPGMSTFVELMQQIYGWTSYDILISQLLGLPINQKIETKTGLVAYILATSYGKVNYVDTAKLKKENITKIKVYYKPGQIFSRIRLEERGALLGYVFMKDVESDEVECILNDIKRDIDVSIGKVKTKT